MWYTSPPALCDMSCRSRVICVGILAVPARCDTPVPQLLSVMNNVKAKMCNRLKVGKGCEGSNQEVLASSTSRSMLGKG